MYKRDNLRIGDFDICRIHSDSGVYADVIPELGAMVVQIGLLDKEGEIRTILHSDSRDEFEKNPWFRGRILFPFNDRIPEGRYSYKGQNYQLPINSEEDGSAIHGLVYNRSFRELSMDLQDDCGEVTFVYTIDKKDFSYYPFSVELKVTYKLTERMFSVRYTIESHDNDTVPVALGWHPYFSFNQKVDSLLLQAGSGSYIAVDKELNPTGDILSASGSSLNFSKPRYIGDQELDLAFVAREKGKSLLSDGNHLLNIYFDSDLFTFVQLFIPPDRKSIAIEPITSATNSFNMPELGLIDLEPGESKSGLVTIHLS